MPCVLCLADTIGAFVGGSSQTVISKGPGRNPIIFCKRTRTRRDTRWENGIVSEARSWNLASTPPASVTEL